MKKKSKELTFIITNEPSRDAIKAYTKCLCEMYLDGKIKISNKENKAS